MSADLQGQVALVTGAGAGIGRASALAFAAAGACVVAADINAGAAAETAKLVAEAGGQATSFTANVADASAVEAMVAHAVARYGKLDCAFNNAGVSGGAPGPDDWDEALLDRVWSINGKGVLLCLKHEVRQMLKQGRGAIVNMASTAGLVGVGGFSYTMSKHAVVGLTRAAGARYASQNIRINAVCPGTVRTPLVENATRKNPEFMAGVVAAHPIKRLAEPEEIARAVVWLCSDDASYLAGHPLAIDGGFVAQ